jgi:hypothetical protein
MKRDRFWFGTAMIAVPVMLLLVTLSPGFKLTRSGPVEGHVTFRGRPLAGGSILFVPEDPRQGAWALAWIDENGDYRIGSIWSRDGSVSKMRYRICLMPDTHDARSPLLRRSEFKTAWAGPGSNVAFPEPAASSGFPAKLCDPKTTRFEVVLGSEPAHVDITF